MRYVSLKFSLVSTSSDAVSFGVNGSTMPVGVTVPVDRVTLAAPGAMTHSLDMNQRVVFLQVSRERLKSCLRVLFALSCQLNPKSIYCADSRALLCRPRCAGDQQRLRLPNWQRPDCCTPPMRRLCCPELRWHLHALCHCGLHASHTRHLGAHPQQRWRSRRKLRHRASMDDGPYRRGGGEQSAA